MPSFYCPLPFRHIYMDTTGLSFCCNGPRYDISIQQWVDHPTLKSVQQQLLNGTVPDTCNGCAVQERLHGSSLRTSSNKDYNNQIFTESVIDFIDFRSSNICNFKCRSCEPIFSHGIAQEYRNNKLLKQCYPLEDESKTLTSNEENNAWVLSNLHQIKRLMFTGGEPTVIPGIKNILNEIERHHPNIQVLITTNASFSDKFWYELTERLPNLHWTVSIDAVGDRAEVVRHGTDWAHVEKNVRWLAKNSTSLGINSVVTQLSVLGLKELLIFGREIQLASISPLGKHGDQGCRHQFHLSTGDNRLSADNWPDDLKPRVLDYLTECLNLDLNPEQRNLVQGLKEKIQRKKFNLHLWNFERAINRELDQLRNEDSSTLLK